MLLLEKWKLRDAACTKNVEDFHQHGGFTPVFFCRIVMLRGEGRDYHSVPARFV